MHRLTLTALIVALATPALADSHDEAALPPIEWEQDYLGTYAIDGQCDDPSQMWVLTNFQVDMGTIRCSAFGKMTFEEEGLVVPMSQCREGSTEVANRTIAFLHGEDETLTASEGLQSVQLQPCAGETPVQ